MPSFEELAKLPDASYVAHAEVDAVNLSFKLISTTAGSGVTLTKSPSHWDDGRIPVGPNAVGSREIRALNPGDIERVELSGPGVAIFTISTHPEYDLFFRTGQFGSKWSWISDGDEIEITESGIYLFVQKRYAGAIGDYEVTEDRFKIYIKIPFGPNFANGSAGPGYWLYREPDPNLTVPWGPPTPLPPNIYHEDIWAFSTLVGNPGNYGVIEVVNGNSRQVRAPHYFLTYDVLPGVGPTGGDVRIWRVYERSQVNQAGYLDPDVWITPPEGPPLYTYRLWRDRPTIGYIFEKLHLGNRTEYKRIVKDNLGVGAKRVTIFHGNATGILTDSSSYEAVVTMQRLSADGTMDVFYSKSKRPLTDASPEYASGEAYWHRENGLVYVKDIWESNSNAIEKVRVGGHVEGEYSTSGSWRKYQYYTQTDEGIGAERRLASSMMTGFKDGVEGAGSLISRVKYANSGALKEKTWRLPSELVTSYINGGTEQVVAKTSYTYGAPNGGAEERVQQHRHVGANYLWSSTRRHSRYASGDKAAFRGMPIFEWAEDGTQIAYIHQVGSILGGAMENATFTPHTGGSCIRIITLRGVPPSTSEGNEHFSIVAGVSYSFNDSLFLVPYESTATVELWDARGDKRRTDELVHTGAGVLSIDGSFSRVGWTVYDYEAGNRMIQRRDSRGNTWSWMYSPQTGRVATYTDEAGTKVSYAYDGIGRVVQEIVEGITGVSGYASQANRITTYRYDAADRVIEIRQGAPGQEQLVTIRNYYQDGRLKYELLPGGEGWHYTYPLEGAINTKTVKKRVLFAESNGVLSVVQTLGVEMVTEFYRDGSIKSVNDPANVPSNLAGEIPVFHFTEIGTFPSGYGDVGNAVLQHTVRSGGVNSPRWSRIGYDMLGRTVFSAMPGFQGAGELRKGFGYSGSGNYGATRPIFTREPLLPATHLEYGTNGHVKRTFLDVNMNGILDAMGIDRTSETQVRYIQDSQQHWWLQTQVLQHISVSSNKQAIVSRKEERLTGFSGGLVAETRAYGASALPTQNPWAPISAPATVSKVWIDRNARVVRSETFAPGVSTPEMAFTHNGLLVENRGKASVRRITSYDALGRPVKRTGARSVFETIAYKAGSTLISSITDNTGYAIVNCEYDLLGRVSREWTSFSYRTESGAPEQRTLNKYFSYNARGQVTHEWGNWKQPARYTYDDMTGERVYVDTYRGGAGWNTSTLPAAFSSHYDRRQWIYDPHSGLLAKEIDATAGDASTKGMTEFSYDVAHRLKSTRTPNGKTILRNYSATTGDLQSKTYPGSSESGPDDDTTPDVIYQYDRLGRVTAITDGLGQRTFSYNSDASSNSLMLNRETLSNQFGSYKIISRTYDGYRRSTGFEIKNNPSTSGAVIVKQIATYNPVTGRLSEVAGQYASGSVSDSVEYSYALDSNFVSQVRNQNVFRGSEPEARLVRQNTFESNRNIIAVARNYVVPPSGSQQSLATTTYAHNALGQLETEWFDGEMYGPIYGSGGTGLRSEHFYTERGELEYSSGRLGSGPYLASRQMRLTYDNAGNRTAVANAMENGAWNSVAWTANENNQYTLVQNLPHDFVTGSTPGGIPPVQVYDEQQEGWILGNRPGGGEFFEVKYPSTGYWSQWSYDYPRRFFYNGYGDLSLWYKGTPQRPQYDKSGNMLWDGPVESGVRHGFLGINYTYDTENRLIQLENGVFRITFRYDYMNRRCAQSLQWRSGPGWTAAETTYFIYDGWNLVAEYRQSGTNSTVPLRAYTWGLDISNTLDGAGGIGGMVLMYDFASQKRYAPGYDKRGNVIFMYGIDDGVVVSEYEYDPFGKLIRCTGREKVAGQWTRVARDPLRNKFRYQTKWHMDAVLDYEDMQWDDGWSLDLYDFGHRFYAPGLGRFVNRDPLGIKAGLNPYAYAENNPMSFYDRLGLEADTTEDKEKIVVLTVEASQGPGSSDGQARQAHENASQEAASDSTGSQQTGSEVVQNAETLAGGLQSSGANQIDPVLAIENAVGSHRTGFDSEKAAGIAASGEARDLTVKSAYKDDKGADRKYEYGGEIFSYKDRDGNIKFGYAPPRQGNKGSYTSAGTFENPGPVIDSRIVPQGTNFSGGYHSHTGTNGFSAQDRAIVSDNGVNLYLGRKGLRSELIVERLMATKQVREPSSNRPRGEWKIKREVIYDSRKDK